MVVLSAALHVAAVGLAIILPYTFRDTSPKLVSYTVDLVAPDRLGGTNIPGRPKSAPQAKPKAPPPRPAAESAPVAPPKPPEPVKKEPPPKAAEKEAAPPPKPVAKAKEEAKKPPVKVSAKKAEKPKPAPAKEKPKPAEKKAAEKPQPAVKKEVAAEKPKAAPAKKEAAAAELSPEQAREAIAARLRDERLAAAVARAAGRVEEQEAVGDGEGPASYGPGEGAGGILKGLDWIMYKNRVETLIRESWAWTGSDRSLEATVSFGINEAGEVINFRIEQSSGDATYDASIERAIKGVSPLPPPPEAYREEFSQYELTFNAEFLQM